PSGARAVPGVRDRARMHPVDAAVGRRRRRAEDVKAVGGGALERAKGVRQIRSKVHTVAARELFAMLAFGRLDAEFERSPQRKRELFFVVVTEAQLAFIDRQDPAEYGLEVAADEQVGERQVLMRRSDAAAVIRLGED